MILRKLNIFIIIAYIANGTLSKLISKEIILTVFSLSSIIIKENILEAHSKYYMINYLKFINIIKKKALKMRKPFLEVKKRLFHI